MAMGVAEEGAVEVVDMGAVAMEVVAAEVAAAAMVRIIQIIYDVCLVLIESEFCQLHDLFNAEYFLYIEINGITCSLKVVAMGAMVVVVEVVAAMEAAVVDMEAGEVAMEAEVVAMEVVVEVVAMEAEATSMACIR